MGGPGTWTPGGHARGYSSCGNVPTRHSSALIPPWTRSSGGRPKRALPPLSSPPPRPSPPGLGRRVLEPEALHEPVVEVLLTRAHAADVQREHRSHRVAGGVDVIGHERVDR